MTAVLSHAMSVTMCNHQLSFVREKFDLLGMVLTHDLVCCMQFCSVGFSTALANLVVRSDVAATRNMLAGKLTLISYASVQQSTVPGMKRKASEMSGGSFGSAISRGSADSGTSANSKVHLSVCTRV